MPFAKINGKELHYTDSVSSSGSSTSLTIVFVHGLGSTQNYYGAILPYLTKYRCITFDNYGAGRSKYDSQTHPDTSIGQIADDVIGLMDYLEVMKAVIVGYSMGGMVPTTIAASEKGSDRIISGICIGPVHPSSQVAEVFKQRVKTVREGKSIYLTSNHIPEAWFGYTPVLLTYFHPQAASRQWQIPYLPLQQVPQQTSFRSPSSEK